MFIPGFGDVSTPSALAATLEKSPGTAATKQARKGILGPLALSGAPGFDTPLNQLVREQRNREQEPDNVTTNGVTQPFRYSPTLPALTPQQQRALMERRRLATRSFEETQAVVGRERTRAEAEALRQQGEVDRARELQSRAGMQTLAGRGVGRSPMFVNPFQRQLAEQSQRQVGELQSGLANTLAELGSALQQAEIGRDRELSQIDFDAVDFRSDVGRLLGA